MKKFAVAIPIAMFCAAAPIAAIASPWGKSPPASEAPQAKASLGFLGRLVARSHEGEPSAEAQASAEMASLTGAQSTQAMVPLVVIDDKPSLVEPVANQPDQKEPAVQTDPVDAIQIPEAPSQLLATTATSQAPEISVATTAEADIAPQPDVSANVADQPQQPTSIAQQETPQKPGFFHRVFDALVPSLTPEATELEVAEETRAAEPLHESLPLKELPQPLVSPPPATLVTKAAPTTDAEAEKPASPQVFTLKSSVPIHIQLQEWAKEAGWALDWKLDTSWAPPVDTEFSGTFQSVTERIIDGLHSEGKQIKLIVWANNYAEVVDVSTR